MPSPDNLVFMMGEYRAEFPTDRLYATNHMWALPTGDSRYRLGLTAYAVRLLQDVYFLDWLVDPPAPLAHRQTIGSIESKKAESDLFAPFAGQLLAVNDESLDDPSAINVDPYSAGWLIEVAAEGPEVLTAEAYIEHLKTAWKVAERTIKGQIQ